ncbi:MAG: hypothetical protein J0H14_14255 [Alphaproteobacteria bacterium]|nr:hypothetical protein [Alphaproteobacteria bacterium]
MKVAAFAALGIGLLLAGCGPTPEEQRAMDQQRCGGYGFAQGSEAFANCMMSTAQQREAQQAADRRAQAARDAADKRARDAAQAAKDQADRDAWDKRTGQGIYSSPPTASSSPTSAADDAIQRDLRKIERAGVSDSSD